MLMFGIHITQVNDPLQKISIERLYRGIRYPKSSFQDFIRQLQTVRSMDVRKYRNLKKQLPYFVGGLFHPAIRRKEHFASIRHFVLDLDHISAAGKNIEEMALQLREIPGVMLNFRSPSGDGLKVLFRLSEECRDAALFSSFYQLFAHRFAQKWGLEQIVDYKTHDVTRACFLSYDPGAWYDPIADEIDMNEYITANNFDKAEKDIRETEQAIQKAEKRTETMKTSGPDEDTLLKIKQKLNPNYRLKKKKEYYVPPEVDTALELLKKGLPAYDIQLAETSAIQYGRKLKLQAGSIWAEVNIFYGKRGYSIVKTPKTGSNPDLATLAVQVLEEILEL